MFVWRAETGVTTRPEQTRSTSNAESLGSMMPMYDAHSTPYRKGEFTPRISTVSRIHYTSVTNQLALITPPPTCSALLLLFTTLNTVCKRIIKLILVRKIATSYRLDIMNHLLLGKSLQPSEKIMILTGLTYRMRGSTDARGTCVG